MSTSPPSENLAPAFHTHVKQVVDIKSDDSSDLNANQIAISSISKDEPLVTRRELWSYDLYSNGGNGVGLGYTQTLFQGLATVAGYDPVAGPGPSCLADTASGQCVVPWGSGTKSVSSVMLTADGASFAIMTAVLTALKTVVQPVEQGRAVFWTQLALSELQKTPDTQGIKIVDGQKESVLGHKQLADRTKEFKKIPDDEKLNSFEGLLKEIDSLTKWSKVSENVFLNMYEVLAEVPDPYPILYILPVYRPTNV
ncbi:hypothetical protein DFJ58DRAFT_872185 [Suillus subalutaceus]|uniref:uncharacterized protein n=1 Tax=Suillus subalutaceus TaxID=48586 RepID=UPI001B85BC6B|nr:uncharacterized protein DFJ58DRAFT_872185 [Suillus subalutaceus]KAG1831186.1 hypothetical protein DFJ58DRAFT_872185 [Suillus subalutaceus]